MSVEPRLEMERKAKKNEFIIDTMDLESLDRDSSEAEYEATIKLFDWFVFAVGASDKSISNGASLDQITR